ncbi:MAG: hypothetical protein RMY29_008800 [Nostoc sp. CreGUA01]|nr:hypothetical protein [Nostoc sp. CreGUA01]
MELGVWSLELRIILLAPSSPSSPSSPLSPPSPHPRRFAFNIYEYKSAGE